MRVHVLARVVHLVKRALGSLSNAPVGDSEREAARAVLTTGEFDLWRQMPARDQRHSLQVLARFDRLVPDAELTARAAALLHDVGKVDSALGWTMRVVATVVGPRGDRFARYHDHERIGALMLRSISDRETVELVSGESKDERVLAALRRADDL
jgi:hypothetical protein